MKINYKSDFKLQEVSDTVDLTTPFRFTYSVDRSIGRCYLASFDGANYTNCRRLEDGSLLVIFDHHQLSTGRLGVQREYYLTDSDFKDGICNTVTVDTLDITLTAGAGDISDDITVEVYPNYQMGDTGDSAYEVALKNGFEGSEAEWLESLRGKDGNTGEKGDDYTLTDQDKTDIATEAAGMVDLSNVPTKTELEKYFKTEKIKVLDRIEIGTVTIYKTTKTEDDGTEVEAGYIYTDRGNIYTTKGNIYTSDGEIYTTKGDIYTVNGDFVARSGSFFKGTGDDKVEVAYKDELPATIDIAQFVGNDTSGTVTAEYYANLESIASRGSSITIGGYASADGIIMTIPITVMSDGGGGVAISFYTGMNTNMLYMVTILNNLSWTLISSDLATKNYVTNAINSAINDSWEGEY
ncbi:MAG: hypothetical protein SNG90_09610 [Rikenellaceae bacterium]